MMFTKLLPLMLAHRVLLRRVFLTLLLCTVATKLCIARLGIVRVTTPSVQPGYYSTEPLGEGSVSRGDLVCAEKASAGAPPVLRNANIVETSLIKRVAGLPGDVVDYDGSHIIINGRAIAASRVLATDSKGKPLPRVAFPVTLGPDELWLTSDDPRGFDSRYFGPVKREALSRRATLVWTR